MNADLASDACQKCEGPQFIDKDHRGNVIIRCDRNCRMDTKNLRFESPSKIKLAATGQTVRGEI